MTFLRDLWTAWKRLARIIGDFQARLLLTVLYVVLIVPVGLVIRLLSDPLQVRGGASGTHWREPHVAASTRDGHEPDAATLLQLAREQG